jgi:sugar O-acyltransferase (sialic acid O-acetyltransferase NeuD family)
MKTLGIFGTSGHARDVADIGEALGHRVVFIARDGNELAAWNMPGDVILESQINLGTDWLFAIGIGENAVREKVARRHQGRLRFAHLLHPSASFGRGQRAQIEARSGVIVCAGVRFANNIQVGDFCIFNLNATVGHDVTTEDFVNVSPGANISGNVHLGARCWVGTGSAINQGTAAAKLRIGADTMVGSGSVVVRDCEPSAVYVGIPAKRIK